MRPKGMSKQDLEVRRRIAMALVEAGWTHREIADHLGCASSAVAKWRKAAREEGLEEGLVAKPEKGRPRRRKLSTEEQEELVRLLVEGPTTLGLPTDLWTRPRVRQLILDRFGVDYAAERELAIEPQRNLSAAGSTKKGRSHLAPAFFVRGRR